MRTKIPLPMSSPCPTTALVIFAVPQSHAMRILSAILSSFVMCYSVNVLLFVILQNITDDGVHKIAQGCPDLHVLCLSDCANIKDDSLISLSNHCRNLKTLEVALCSNLTDVGFVSLAKVSFNYLTLDSVVLISSMPAAVYLQGKVMHFITSGFTYIRAVFSGQKNK